MSTPKDGQNGQGAGQPDNLPPKNGQNGHSNGQTNGSKPTNGAKSPAGLTLQPRPSDAEGPSIDERTALIAQMTGHEEMFCLLYLKYDNGSRAAREAGYKTKNVRTTASEILTKPHIRRFIDLERAARRTRIQVETDDLVKVWLDIGTVDVNELIEHRRVCCRFCWGDGHEFQRTPREYREAAEKHDNEMAAHAAALDAWQAAGSKGKAPKMPPPFKELGGQGYDQRLDADPECPECFGDGVSVAVILDSRDLSPAARRAYAGVKVSKDGSMQLMLRDQDGALDKVARAIGSFIDLSADLTNFTPEQRKARVLELAKLASERMKAARRTA